MAEEGKGISLAILGIVVIIAIIGFLLYFYPLTLTSAQVVQIERADEKIPPPGGRPLALELPKAPETRPSETGQIIGTVGIITVQTEIQKIVEATVANIKQRMITNPDVKKCVEEFRNSVKDLRISGRADLYTVYTEGISGARGTESDLKKYAAAYKRYWDCVKPIINKIIEDKKKTEISFGVPQPTK